MAYRAGVVGASGYTGAELLRLLAGHPEIDAVHVTADSNAGRTVGELYPVAGRRPTAACSSRSSTPPTSPGSTSCSSRCRTASRRRSRPRSLAHVAHVVDIGADFRLPADAYEQWHGAAHAAPELIDEFAYGLVELYRPELAAADHVANPGCYPTAVSLALAPLLAGGLVEPDGIVADACSGVSGAGRKLKTGEPLQRGRTKTSSAYSLLTHYHTAEMEQALAHVARRSGVAAVHAAPRADDARHSRHLLRAPAASGAVDRAACSSTTATSTATSPFVSRVRRVAAHEGDHRLELGARHRALRRPHRNGRRDRGRGQPREGRVGSGDPERQPAARSARRRSGLPAVGMFP